jgi:hypothetical protein
VSRLLVIGALLAVLAAVGSPAGAQSAPACPASVVAQSSFDVFDVDEDLNQTTFIATHTIRVDLNLTGASVDESTVQFSVPPGVPVLGSSSPLAQRLNIDAPTRIALQPPGPGPLPITATWTQDNGSGTGSCTGSASTTIQMGAATPIRMGDPRHNKVNHVNLKFDIHWDWGTVLSKTADLRPIQVRLRGVAKAHLPGPKVPFKSITVGLRASDTSFAPDRQRKLRSPRWLVEVTAGSSGIAISGNIRGLGDRPKPVAYEVQVLQAGRLLGRLAAAGKCSVFNCTFRTVKLTR